MRPIWVFMPVSVTTNVPVPRVTVVFWKTMLAWSPSGTSSASSAAASFETGALSPVRAASWVSNVATRRSRPSAGTRSPASTLTMSPGTSSVAATWAERPSRSTFACGTCIFARASTLARACSSCLPPRTVFSTTRALTMMPTGTWSMKKLATPTTSSMMFIGSLSWSR